MNGNLNPQQQQQLQQEPVINDRDLEIFSQLLENTKIKISYLEDCRHQVIQQWAQIYYSSLAYFNQIQGIKQNIENQMEPNHNILQVDQSCEQTYDSALLKLKKVEELIKIIHSDNILLVGQFHPWMSGIGMMQIPLKQGNSYKIIGEIKFGKLHGKGLFITSQNYKIHGTFVQNILFGVGIITNGLGTLQANFQNNQMADGDFQLLLKDKRKLTGHIVFELIDGENVRCYQNINYFNSNNLKLSSPSLNLKKIFENFTLFEEVQLIHVVQKGRIVNGFGSQQFDKMVYIGQFKDGQLSGNGQVKINQQIFKQGIFQNNQMIEGKVYYYEFENQLKEEGYFLEDQLHGQGVRYHYEYNFKNKYDHSLEENQQNDLIQGFQNLENQNKSEEGLFENGLLIEGTKYFENGKIFEKGKFVNGKLTGEGERRYENGACESYGIFLDGLLHSEVQRFVINSEFCIKLEEGYFLKGKLNGQGKKYSPQGRLIEEGGFLDGELNGQGERYYDNDLNSIAERGVFNNGKLHSQDQYYESIQYYENGRCKSIGQFQFGQLWRRGVIFFDHYVLEGFFNLGEIYGPASLINFKQNLRFIPSQGYKSTASFLKHAFENKVYESDKFEIKSKSQTIQELYDERKHRNRNVSLNNDQLVYSFN